MSEIFVNPRICTIKVILTTEHDPEWSGSWVVNGYQKNGVGHRMSVGFESEIRAWEAVVVGDFDTCFDIDYSEKLIAAAVVANLKEQGTPDLTKELLPE